MSAVGFEPTSANTIELESTPLDRSGTLTISYVLAPHSTCYIITYQQNINKLPQPSTTAHSRPQPLTIVINHLRPRQIITYHQHIQNVDTASSVTQLYSNNIRHTNPPALVLLLLVESLFNCRRYSIDTSQSSLSFLLRSFVVKCFLLLHCLIEEHSRYEAYHDVDSTQRIPSTRTGAAQTTTTLPNEILTKTFR